MPPGGSADADVAARLPDLVGPRLPAAHELASWPGAAGLTPDDLRHLTRAVRLGRLGWGRVHPNPMVGCVLARDGEMVAEGHHKELGGPHAEVRALAAAGARARGADAYVSLEPCAHHGRTPPCTLALIEAGVRRVVFAAPDPGVDSAGGARALRDAGIDVAGPVWTPAAARRENPAFFHAAAGGGPWVVLKLAVSLDARIAAAPGHRTDISGASAREWAHVLRAGFDAILVGAGTVRTDDPLLTVRGPVRPRVAPRRLVVDTAGSVPPTAALLRDVSGVPVTVFVGPGAPVGRRQALEAAGASVEVVPGAPGGVDLDAVLARCRDAGVGSILCEGGGHLASSFLAERRAGRLHLVVAPRVLGAVGVPAFPGPFGPDALAGWTSVPWEGSLGKDAHVVFDREG